MIRNHAPKKLYLTAWCFIATFLGIFFVLFVKFLFYSYFCALGILANCNSDELTFANLEHAKTDLKSIYKYEPTHSLVQGWFLS